MILTKTIKTEKAEILVVGGLPKDATDICIDEGELSWYAPHPYEYDKMECSEAPEGDWLPLGKLEDIPEEQWYGVVDYFEYGLKDNTYRGFKDYRPENCFTDTATESGMSLIKQSCKLDNRYEGNFLRYGAFERLYKKEQEQVFTDPVIFVRK